MALLFFSSPAWQLILQSDAVTKVILSGLFMLSIGCVTLIIAQSIFMYFVNQSSKQSQSAIKHARTVADLQAIVQKHDSYEALLIKTLITERNRIQTPHLNEHQKELLLTVGEHEADSIVQTLERFIPVLGVSGAVSPLIGLFGTVWGLIHAFINISHEKSADIAVVAPGIAEALFTTLAGLLVAIPALIFFHYISHQIKQVDWNLRQTIEWALLIITQES